jgi:hypothetical protein
MSQRDARARARSRARVRRRRALAALLVAALAAALALLLSGGAGRSRPRHSAQARAPAALVRPARAARRHPHAARAIVPDPGSLPQTHALPPATSAEFSARMAALWAGVARGSSAPALSAFFPEGAYVKLKAIPSASSDWTARLVGEYDLDIAAAHALLGAAPAQLVAVNVPSGFAHWVEPGVCYNGIGYWEVPNARVVYRQRGQLRSFGIASMISWRGQWYVVHLGAVLRSGSEGVVDEPATGPGTSADSGTC